MKKKQVRSKNPNKKIFFIQLSYLNSPFLNTVECKDWIKKITNTKIGKQMILTEDENTKLLRVVNREKYLYLSFIQGQNLDEDFVEAEELIDIELPDDVRIKRLYVFMYNKVTDEILCNWPKSGKYSHKKYKELLFDFFEMDERYSKVKLIPYLSEDFVDKITTLDKLTLGYATAKQQLALFSENEDLPLQNLTEIYGNQHVEITLSQNIKFLDRQKKDLKKKLREGQLKILAIGHDDRGMKYALDNSKITRNTTIKLDYNNIDHDLIISQLLELGGLNHGK